MINICYLDGGAFFDPSNSVRVRVLFCLELQVVKQCTRNNVVVTFVMDDEVAHLVSDRTP